MTHDAVRELTDYLDEVITTAEFPPTYALAVINEWASESIVEFGTLYKETEKYQKYRVEYLEGHYAPRASEFFANFDMKAAGLDQTQVQAAITGTRNLRQWAEDLYQRGKEVK